MPAASADAHIANLDVFNLFSLLSCSSARLPLIPGNREADWDRKRKTFGATDAMRNALDKVCKGLCLVERDQAAKAGPFETFNARDWANDRSRMIH